MSGAAGVLASSISSVLAQDTAEIAEVVIVTGSYIRGSAEDAALPIDVISAEELEKSGSPTVVDLLKNLSVSSGALGDTNQFAAGSQGTEGTGSVNLRNLGRQRTLVLLNGRRLVNAPQSGSPDTNLIPAGAIGRVEVLKDGAAATYGSDAIAGVVNFITNDRLDGLEIGGSYKYIEDTDGDYDTKIAWGWQGDSSSFIASASYQHRSELRTTDRGFAVRSFADNPQSFSSGGNPGTFFIPGQTLLATTATGMVVPAGTPGSLPGTPGAVPFNGPASVLTSLRRDPGCDEVGGTRGFTDTRAPACYFNFVPFDNLVEKQDQYQGFVEYNVEFGETNRLHVEGFYSQTDVPEYRTSPSFLANQVPTPAIINRFDPNILGPNSAVAQAFAAQITATALAGGVPAPQAAGLGAALGAGAAQGVLGGRYIIPNYNPGVQDLRAAFAGQLSPTASALLANPAGAVVDFNPLFRPFGVGGNPKTGSTNLSDRKADAFRVSTSLTGELSDRLKWDFGLTYSENNYLSTNNDILVSRLQAALFGFGGFNCTGTTPGQNGCLFYNPFSSAIAGNATTGQANPNFSAGAANSQELGQFLFGKNDLDRKSTLVVADAVFSGETGLELPGGNLAWAAGAQFRESDFQSRYSQLGNYATNPCVDPGDRSCLNVAGQPGVTNPSQATGVFMFLGGGFDVDVQQNVYATFGEVSLPVLDSLSLQLAARYEDYGGQVGDTFDPKLSVRYQATDWLAFRGSVGTSFRGPPEVSLTTNSATALQFLQQAGGFRAIRIFGDPNLEPEDATTFNVGVLLNGGGFRGSIDYFSYQFDNPFVIEDFTAIVGEVFRSGTVNCASPVARRIVFNNNAPCGTQPADQIAAVNTFQINGPGIDEDGIDVNAEYAFNNVFGGALTVGINATYTLNFDVDPLVVEGVTVSPAFDGAGFSNVNTGYTPLPELKGSAFVDWSRGNQNVRAIVRYVDSYTDTRSLLDPARNIFVPRAGNIQEMSANEGNLGLGITAANTRGLEIASYTTLDLAYVLQLPADTTFSASMTNVTDRDPPFARLELSYDPTVVSPLGRTVEVGFRKKF
jgi:iron complex outermembrane receptor protein